MTTPIMPTPDDEALLRHLLSGVSREMDRLRIEQITIKQAGSAFADLQFVRQLALAEFPMPDEEDQS